VESENEKLVRISTAAKMTGMVEASIYSAIRRGKLAYTDMDGWKMVRVSDVLRYKENAKPGRRWPRGDADSSE
jgi:hypothetical protein